jgi:hypothetical protein
LLSGIKEEQRRSTRIDTDFADGAACSRCRKFAEEIRSYPRSLPSIRAIRVQRSSLLSGIKEEQRRSTRINTDFSRMQFGLCVEGRPKIRSYPRS